MTIFKDDEKVNDFTNWINFNNIDTKQLSYQYSRFLYTEKVLCSETIEEYFKADGIIEISSAEYSKGYLDYNVRKILLKKDDFIEILDGLKGEGKAELNYECVYMDKTGTMLKIQYHWINKAELKGKISLKGSELDMSNLRYENKKVIRHFSEFI